MLHAVGSKVVLEIVSNLDRFAEDVKKRSGLLVSSKTIQGQPNTGRVYSVGPDANLDLKAGQIVIFNKQNVFEGIRFDDKELVAVDAFEIVAVIDDESSN